MTGYQPQTPGAGVPPPPNEGSSRTFVALPVQRGAIHDDPYIGGMAVHAGEKALLTAQDSPWDRPDMRALRWGLLALVVYTLLRLAYDFGDQWTGGPEARARLRCQALIDESVEAETRYSKELGCLAKRTDGWERI